MLFLQKRRTPVKLRVPKEVFIQTTVFPSPVASVTLIGTVHHDPRSAAPLAALLEQLQPDRLTVEISPELVVYRQTHGVLLLRKLGMIVERLAGPTAFSLPHAEHPGIKTIRTLLGLPYEFRVASHYARERGIKVQAIDHSDSSLSKLRPVEEHLISVRHLKRIISSPMAAPADNARRYTLARQLLATPDAKLLSAFLQGCRGEEGIGLRDLHLAGKIRSLAQSQSGHLVHIGGWVHLLDDPAGETLYSLLADLHPRRILLDPDQPSIP